MGSNILANIFEHHRWSNLVLIDFLSGLTDEQLELTVPGTYGSPISTFATSFPATPPWCRGFTLPPVDTRGPGEPLLYGSPKAERFRSRR